MKPYGVESKLRVNTRQLTNQHGKAWANPSAIVGEIAPDFFVGGSGSIDPNGDDEGKVSEYVDREGNVLPKMQHFVAKYISAKSYSDCSDNKEPGMPSGECVGFVVDGDEGLDDSANEINANCISCLPGHSGSPATTWSVEFATRQVT